MFVSTGGVRPSFVFLFFSFFFHFLIFFEFLGLPRASVVQWILRLRLHFGLLSVVFLIL